MNNVGLLFAAPVLSFSPATLWIAARRIFASFCDKKYYPRELKSGDSRTPLLGWRFFSQTRQGQRSRRRSAELAKSRRDAIQESG
ncbi:MAG: hypothetical protein BGO52_00285 [Sphingobacteriales bacterium 44-61]|nr:MAG: hypothetical protein BGO52_00285 [Sphingobacteriales bacterium 44-61]